MKRAPVDKMELIETILVIRNETYQMSIEIKKKRGNEAQITPAPVATPLPPRNPKNGVKICPKMAAPPKRSDVCSRLYPAHNLDNANEGINPFKKSIMNTAIPGPFPITRIALVAPTLPLPSLRMSIPLIFFTKT